MRKTPKITLLKTKTNNTIRGRIQKDWIFKVGRTIYTLTEVWVDGELVNGGVSHELVHVANLNEPFAKRLKEKTVNQ
jgi:hypothetical protein